MKKILDSILLSWGGDCPYCDRYAAVRKNRRQGVHMKEGKPCPASGLTLGEASELRARVGSGQTASEAKSEMKASWRIL